MLRAVRFRRISRGSFRIVDGGEGAKSVMRLYYLLQNSLDKICVGDERDDAS